MNRCYFVSMYVVKYIHIKQVKRCGKEFPLVDTKMSKSKRCVHHRTGRQEERACPQYLCVVVLRSQTGRCETPDL